MFISSRCHSTSGPDPLEAVLSIDNQDRAPGPVFTIMSLSAKTDPLLSSRDLERLLAVSCQTVCVWTQPEYPNLPADPPHKRRVSKITIGGFRL